MKKIFFTLLIAFSLNAAYAQKSSLSTSQGSWVVESNISSPKEQVIKFYNSRSELIYQEHIRGKKLRYEKDSVKKALNKTLDIALSNEKQIKPGTLAMVLKTKKNEIQDLD